MEKISKQEKLMNEVKNNITKSDINEYIELVHKGDSMKKAEMNEFDLTEEEYNIDVESHDERYEDDKYDKHNGPGGKKLTDEQIKEAAKMLAETEAYIKRKDGKITFGDLKAFPQDRETIKNVYNARKSIQKCRIAVGNLMNAITRLAAYNGEDRHPIAIMYAYLYLLEAEHIMDDCLKQYANMYPVGVWAQSICGIGPVFAASLCALFSLEDRKYAGQFWSYAGMTGNPDHDIKQKGKSIKFNPDVRTLCFNISGSFMKNKFRDNCDYGHLIDQITEVYNRRNDEGGFKENAEFYLKIKNWNPEKPTYKIYKSGKLPKSHITMMARRYAVKRFLAHLFEAFWYAEHYNDGLKDKCPDPYVEEHLGHHKIIHAPNLEIIDQWYQNNGYDNLMADIDDQLNDNPDKTVDDIITPKNEVETIIVTAYKKSRNGKQSMRLRMTKVGSKEDSTDNDS